MAFLPNMTEETLATLFEMLETGELCDLLVKGNDEHDEVHNIHALVFALASSELVPYCDRTKENVLPFSGHPLDVVDGRGVGWVDPKVLGGVLGRGQDDISRLGPHKKEILIIRLEGQGPSSIK